MIFGTFINFDILSGLISMVCNAFFGVAVYKDAKDDKDQYVVLWTILACIFGIFPTLVYVIVKYWNTKDFIICEYCGQLISKKYPICMYCKNHVNNNFGGKELINDEAKKYLIIAVVLYILNMFIKLRIFDVFFR